MQNIKVIRVNMVREKGFRYETRTIISPEVATGILYKYFNCYCNTDRENFIVMCLNTKNEINAMNLVSTGTLNGTSVHPREIFKAAILVNSAAIMLCHNHPSGNVKPSEEDIQVTKRLIEVGEILGVPVLDHIVLGNDGVTSCSLKAINYI